MYTINGRPIPQNAGFTDANGTQYPANWLLFASSDEKAALGIEWINDPEPFDDRFYWSAGHPKDLSQLKEDAIYRINQTTWQFLNPTDFMDSRKANDPDYEAPAAWLEWRASIRSTAAASKIAIESAETVEDLIPLVSPQWPSDPSQGGV